jgi:hypothetical protein
MRLLEFTNKISSFNESLKLADKILAEVKKEYEIYIKSNNDQKPMRFYEFASNWLTENEDKICSTKLKNMKNFEKVVDLV